MPDGVIAFLALKSKDKNVKLDKAYILIEMINGTIGFR